MVRVGFTGSREGMTDAQADKLWSLLLGLREARRYEDAEFHHGDCVGSDDRAHDIAVHRCGYEPVIHPPANHTMRAFRNAERVAEPLPYRERNQSIVRETDELIATPREEVEQLRSGTWSTIRFAKKLGRKVTIILPNGSQQ